MKREITIVWGALLIIAGVLFFVQSLLVDGNVLAGDRAWAGLWSITFAAAAASFGWVFWTDRRAYWWAAIPALTLLGLASLTGLNSLGVTGNSEWLGALFLGSIGLSFLVVYLVRREFWWALIPAGALFSLAATVLASKWAEGTVAGAVLFFGLAITFAALALLPTEHGHLIWAFIPAAVLAALGALVLVGSGSAANVVWAIALILGGLYLLYRQYRGRDMMQRR